MDPFVVAVSRSVSHTFSKPNVGSINLIKNFGVEGDAHAGEKVKHRYLVGIDPTRPNIRQVHLIHAELLDALNRKGFSVHPGQLGENITTRGIDILNFPKGTQLHIGESVVVELTALRNPCIQIDRFQKGLLKQVVYKDKDGNVVRKAGVMAIVVKGGVVYSDDEIKVEFPSKPYQTLEYIW